MHSSGQEQQQEPDQTYQSALSRTSGFGPVPNPPGSGGDADTRLDVYLDAVCALVPSEVPAASIQDIRHEMRGHLQAAVVAGEELGQTREEATSCALAQFGEPQVVAKQWRREWETTLEASTQTPVLPSLKLALKVWAVTDIIAVAACALITSLVYSDSPGVRSILIMGVMAALPQVTGAIIGLRARRHPVLCTLGRCLLMTPLLVVGLIAVNYLSYYQAVQVTGKPMEMYRDNVSLAGGLRSAFSCIPTWLVVSGFSSSIMAIGRRLRTRKRRQIAN